MDRGGWALWKGARSTWTRFETGRRSLPPAAVAAWFRTMLVGELATFAFVAALALLARARVDDGLQAWDQALLERIAALSAFDFQQAVWWEAYGASSVLIPIVVLSTLIAARAGRPLMAATLGVGYLLAKPIIFTGWALWDRGRPSLVAEGIAAPPLHSFPSGHAMQAAAIYGLLAYLWIRRGGSRVEAALGVLLVAGLVFLVGLARLRMGVHWPSDVIAGAAVGFAWMATLIAAIRRAEAAGGL